MEKEIRWLLEEKYSGKPTKKFTTDVKRLEAGEPLDYVIGFTHFLGCKIDMSKRPLIPRPETEFWVQKTIEQLSYDFNGREKRKIRVLDIFSGSGCIGVAVLKHVKNSQVTFADSEKECVEQIKKNCKINNISFKNYHIIWSNIFENINGKFDYIFANPPYIPTKSQKSKGKIQKSVLKYEPHVALFGGEDGMEYIRKFLAGAKNFLTPHGKIYMEFDPPQKSAIEKTLKKYGYKSWKFHKDQYRKTRYVVVEN